ncbi:ras and EF-hand domain-containing protein-like [Choloepus didactylus]|uniref:ras and EF-hand domain-containing protein-like n=1 Tax=Choloepus didactylus TaxID=27675 RepID=UPI0018A0102D|nr:ras and EF-hand domain-containing protein-like [Choloepus didactylus]
MASLGGGITWEAAFEHSGLSQDLLPRKEQASTLYENINLVELRLIQPYEHVITNCICEIKLQSPEMENLAIAVKRGLHEGNKGWSSDLQMLEKILE